MGDEATAKGTRGEFFSVDRKGWEAATKLGLNPAVAYLVLARFSDRANRYTDASTHAVEEHTGISRQRAKKAIESLLEVRTTTKQHPVSLRGRQRFETVTLEIPPLLRKVSAEGAARPRYEFTSSEPSSEPIWLPNAIVTGAANETPPVEALRRIQDVLTLRLFVDLYRVQNLRESEGIDRTVMRQSYVRTPVAQASQFQVWSFEPKNLQHAGTQSDVMAPHLRDGKWDDSWERIEALGALRLIEWVPHLYESDDPDAEALFPCGGAENTIEGQIGQAAAAAAMALLTKFRSGERAWDRAPPGVLVPVEKHLKRVQMVGIARLRYRPRTGLTSAWWGELQEKGRKTLSHFQGILKSASP